MNFFKMEANMKLLTVAKVLSFCGLIASTGAIFAMDQFEGQSESEPSKPVIALHTSVIAPNGDVSGMIGNALTMAPKILWRHPKMLFDVQSIVEKGKSIAKETQGTGNIIHKLVEDLRQKGHNLSEETEKAILGLSIGPVPNQEAVQFIAQAKQQGHTVIGISNRDTEDMQIFTEMLQKKGVDLDTLLAGLVNIPAYHKVNLQGAGHIFDEANTNHVIAQYPMPDESFSRGMRALADTFAKGASIFYVVEKPEKAEQQIDPSQDQQYNMRGFESLQTLEQELQKPTEDVSSKMEDLD